MKGPFRSGQRVRMAYLPRLLALQKDSSIHPEILDRMLEVAGRIGVVVDDDLDAPRIQFADFPYVFFYPNKAFTEPRHRSNRYHNASGDIGIILHKGFGGGWWTSSPEYPALLFDPILVQAVLDKDVNRILDRAKILVPDFLGSLQTGAELSVEFVKPNTRFIVDCEDGRETLRCRDSTHWFKA